MDIFTSQVSDGALILLAVAGLMATLVAIIKDTQVRQHSPRPGIA